MTDNNKVTYVAKHAFSGQATQSQLSFAAGARVVAAGNQRGAWWWGCCNGQDGWFPPAYVTLAQQQQQQQQSSLLPATATPIMPHQHQQQQQHQSMSSASFGMPQPTTLQQHQPLQQQQQQPLQQSAHQMAMQPPPHLQSGFRAGTEDPFAGLEAPSPAVAAAPSIAPEMVAPSISSGGNVVAPMMQGMAANSPNGAFSNKMVKQVGQVGIVPSLPPTTAAAASSSSSNVQPLGSPSPVMSPKRNITAPPSIMTATSPMISPKQVTHAATAMAQQQQQLAPTTTMAASDPSSGATVAGVTAGMAT